MIPPGAYQDYQVDLYGNENQSELGYYTGDVRVAAELDPNPQGYLSVKRGRRRGEGSGVRKEGIKVKKQRKCTCPGLEWEARTK